MRFLRDAVITLVVLLVVVWIVAYSRIRAGGLSADAEPGAVERGIATRLVRLSIPADAQQQKNPFSAEPGAWRAAADHYGDHCAICHGSDGHGRTDMGENMYPKVPDLADPAIQGLSDGALFSIIQNGIRWTGMPAWKREHVPDDTWKLVSFIRKVPTLSSEELESLRHDMHMDDQDPDHKRDHEHMNPHRQ
jgi:mono/diheme cytochrome c family protein